MTFPVTLGSPAPVAVTISLISSDPSKLSVTPATVSIAAGATAPASQPQVTGLNAGSATITATASGYTSASQTVQVVETMSFVPSSWTIMLPPGMQNLALTLSAPLPAALVVTLSSSNAGVASVPANVTIPANVLSVNVPITGVAQGAATITATAPNIPNATASITVSNVGPVGVISLPANVKVAPGQPAPFPVTLSIAAPAGGVTVSLSSNDPSVTVTPTVFVAAGATAPVTQPQIVGVAFGTATISASAPNYTPAAQAVQVGATLSFTPPTLMIAVGPGNLQLNLSSGAPAAGLTVNLVSSNSGVATVPLAVSFAPGATSANVAVTGVTAGSAVITASTAFATVPGATANVTVTPPTTASIILPTGLQSVARRSAPLRRNVIATRSFRRRLRFLIDKRFQQGDAIAHYSINTRRSDGRASTAGPDRSKLRKCDADGLRPRLHERPGERSRRVGPRLLATQPDNQRTVVPRISI